MGVESGSEFPADYFERVWAAKVDLESLGVRPKTQAFLAGVEPAKVIAAFSAPDGRWDEDKIRQVVNQLKMVAPGAVSEPASGLSHLLGLAMLLAPAGPAAERQRLVDLMVRVVSERACRMLPSRRPDSFMPQAVRPLDWAAWYVRSFQKFASDGSVPDGSLLAVLAAAAEEQVRPAEFAPVADAFSPAPVVVIRDAEESGCRPTKPLVLEGVFLPEGIDSAKFLAVVEKPLGQVYEQLAHGQWRSLYTEGTLGSGTSPAKVRLSLGGVGQNKISSLKGDNFWVDCRIFPAQTLSYHESTVLMQRIRQELERLGEMPLYQGLQMQADTRQSLLDKCHSFIFPLLISLRFPNLSLAKGETAIPGYSPDFRVEMITDASGDKCYLEVSGCLFFPHQQADLDDCRKWLEVGLTASSAVIRGMNPKLSEETPEFVLTPPNTFKDFDDLAERLKKETQVMRVLVCRFWRRFFNNS